VADVELIQTFRFEVTLTRSGPNVPPSPFATGGFAECSGLELEADIREYLEGGRNDGVVRRVGRVKLQPVVLKRGMFVRADGAYADTSFWDWLTGTVTGVRILRCEGHVRVWNPAGTATRAHWSFTGGLPLKVSGPSLNAKTGEIAVEELHIAHQGLRLEATP
jgi:phage tail-like protein